MKRPQSKSAWPSRAACWAIGAIVCLSWTTAQAQTGAAGAKLLVLEGDVDRLTSSEKIEMQRTVDAEIEARPQWAALAKPQESIIDLMFDAECLEPDHDCLRVLGRARGASSVLFYEAHPEGAGFALAIQLVPVEAGSPPSERAVKGASLSAALAQLPKALEEVLGPKPPPKPKMVGLRVRSNPAAATITLNGEEVGVTPLEVRKPAGPYTMRVTREGYEPVERKVELRDKDLDFELVLSPRREVAATPVITDTPSSGSTEDTAEASPAYYETWWFWTAVGVGVVGAGLGIAAAAGAFSEDGSSTGGLTFQLGARPDQDVLIQGQFR